MLYQIMVYVPVSNAKALKKALFEAGAGRYKNYDRCAWETLGTGQFRALDGANPSIGKIHQQEYVDELKIEMICKQEFLKEVIQALLNTHPYEEPAYGIIELKTIEDF